MILDFYNKLFESQLLCNIDSTDDHLPHILYLDTPSQTKVAMIVRSIFCQ